MFGTRMVVKELRRSGDPRFGGPVAALVFRFGRGGPGRQAWLVSFPGYHRGKRAAVVTKALGFRALGQGLVGGDGDDPDEESARSRIRDRAVIGFHSTVST